MGQINVAVIGTGWIGEIRALNCAGSALVKDLYLAELNPVLGERVAKQTGAHALTTNHRELVENPEIDAVIVSTTPESTHYPIAREFLQAKKHVLLEKPMGLTLREADDLVAVAREAGTKFAVGYTQRFNPKFAYVKKCLVDGTLGRPVTALVNCAVSRGIGDKIAKRGRLGPAQMDAPHNVDFVLWCLENLRPKRVYAQSAWGVMKGPYDLPDATWLVVTMDDGMVFTIGANWVLPPGSPHLASTTIEFTGSKGAVLVDDTHRDVLLSTVSKELTRPMSAKPGEPLMAHVYQGPMQAETLHFLDCVANNRPVLVTPEQARQVMEVCIAADLSAERGAPVNLPLPAE